jgi:zinc ribbon protein
MYCPRCGTEAGNDVRFCRTCGADIGLVSRALTGKLAAEPAPGELTRQSAQGLAKAITSSVTGLGFIAVAFCALLFAPAGHLWWFWLLIPAFALLGSGLAEYVRFRSAANASRAWQSAIDRERDVQGRELGGGGFTGALPPASVTESTTRHLGERADEVKQ